MDHKTTLAAEQETPETQETKELTLDDLEIVAGGMLSIEMKCPADGEFAKVDP